MHSACIDRRDRFEDYYDRLMTAFGSYPERLLLVIVLCGATSIVPPRRRVAVGSVIVKLDNSGMFL